MRTKVTKRGYVIIPAKIRKQLQLEPNTILEWAVEGTSARVIPVPEDPVKAFRGSGRKRLVKKLLKERRLDRQREDSSQN